MCHNFSKLKLFGLVRDYRKIKAGDKITIDRSEEILKRTHHAHFERERAAMAKRAQEIGAQLDTQLYKKHIEIRFK